MSETAHVELYLHPLESGWQLILRCALSEPARGKEQLKACFLIESTTSCHHRWGRHGAIRLTNNWNILESWIECWMVL